MKNLILIFLLVATSTIFAQNVVLNKVVKTNTNSDKIFYKINPEETSAEYLGELEVQGFSNEDVKIFGIIYKKAKQIGANAFAYTPFETIDGISPNFDPAHYKLSLYYLPSEDFPKENNVIYLISSPFQKQKIAVNKKSILFQPRTYMKKTLALSEVYTVSTKKLLGSTIQLSGQENQPMQFFQFSGFSVNSKPYGTAGINVKSGDIIRLEQSYGQFLTTIYEEIK